VLPEGVIWPAERPPWSAAAVVLANDALAGESATSGLFRNVGMPEDEPLESIA